MPSSYSPSYKRFIEDKFYIVDKEAKRVPFRLNAIQDKYLTEDGTGKDIILKARQQGFSSLILAIFTTDFLMKENSRSVIVADESENAMELLDRVRGYIECYEETVGGKIPMRYDSKYELYNEIMKSRYSIGTAQKSEFGRSKTITNLHLSEAAFYPKMEKLLAGALQAVTPNGRVIIETTANGFNEFKKFWDSSVDVQGKDAEGKSTWTGFQALFYPASQFYDERFLDEKRMILKDLFRQEYPERPIDAFITSGEGYFDKLALEQYMIQAERYKGVAEFMYADQIR